ncbi:HEAT repeat domain-containing protein [Rivularia sp. PCC 7116]|uniref:HEAT repeat domain-containing protein n=1 Tax=Rivularia sp. PCC 7116 TaxID=373994 RepID=UPI0002D57970|nr:HEAT repeat domain-containing protein [Rivularia sp. PCC 7116]
MAALNDGYLEVQAYALLKLSAYEPSDFKALLKQPDDIAQKAVKIIKDKSLNSSVRSGAANGLGNLGDAAKPYVKDVAYIIKDESVDLYVRSNAAIGLGNMGDAAKPYVKEIADILKDESVNSIVREGAAIGLGNMGDAAKPYVKDIANILKDESVKSTVRGSAADALGNMGDAAKPYVKDIANILKDESVNSTVRGSAAEALGNMGDAAKPYVQDIANILKDKSVDSFVRWRAADALTNMDVAKPYVKNILDLIEDKSVNLLVRIGAAYTLGDIQQLELQEAVIILDQVYDAEKSSTYSFGFEVWRFLTYFLSGSTDEIKTLLEWTGFPQTIPHQITRDESVKTLQIFAKAWEPTQDLTRLRTDLANKIASVVEKGSWQPQDIVLLEQHYRNLKQEGYEEANTLHKVIVNLQG